jgi:hypothetical protein
MVVANVARVVALAALLFLSSFWNATPSWAQPCGGDGEPLCDLFRDGRIGCNSGLANVNGACRSVGVCGNAGGRLCYLFIDGRAGCNNQGLTDVGGICSPCGQDGERACAVLGRNSCDPGLVEFRNTCFVLGACGAENQRACLIGERNAPSCNPNLVERDQFCRSTPNCGRPGQAACAEFGRNSCDDGAVEFRNMCFVRGDCGAEDQRACLIGERNAPSCNPNLIERNQFCRSTPNCGREGQPACAIFGRDSCDQGMVDFYGTCRARGVCGQPRQRPCLFGERRDFSGCGYGGSESRQDYCSHPADNNPSICVLRTSAVTVQGNIAGSWLSDLSYGRTIAGADNVPTGSGLVTGECRTMRGRIETTAIDPATCAGQRVIATWSGALRCSVRPNFARSAPGGGACTNFWQDGPRLMADCSRPGGGSPNNTIDNIGRCPGGLENAPLSGLVCRSETAPEGPYLENCFGARYQGDHLVADCQNLSGEWVNAGLFNARGCRQPINNSNGQLICGEIPSIVVPDVIMQQIDEARRAIEAAGLAVGTVTPRYVGPMQDIVVYRQSWQPGTVLQPGMKIDLTVGIRPPPKQELKVNRVCNGQQQEYLVYCVTCASQYTPSRIYKSQVEGWACSNRDAEAYLEQNFGGCTFKVGACTWR